MAGDHFTARSLRRAIVLLVFAFASTSTAARAQDAPDTRLRGDVDGDGEVTVADALAILRHLDGVPLPARYRFGPVADFDGDGQVTASDAAAISRFVVERIDVVQEFGARRDGTSDDAPAIQAALDAAAARPGGAPVYLPAGTYGISSPLIVRSEVHLTGAGAGRTILRALVPRWGVTVNGAQVYSAVAMVAASHASVSSLTVDLAWASTHSNGVSALPDGEGYQGTPTTDSEISNVEVIGGGNFHAYMIWNLLGERIRILDNVIDGRVTGLTASHQEGIESAGGKDVLIRGNRVRDVGLNGIYVVSSGGAGHAQERIEVVDNHVEGASSGITVSELLEGEGMPGRDMRDLRIEGNRIHASRAAGILVQLIDPGAIHGLRIRGNLVDGVGGPGSPGTGILLSGTPSLSRTPSRISDLVLEENVIRGTTSDAIRTVGFPGVVVRRNDLAGAGILIHAGDGATIEGNRIYRAPASAIRTWIAPGRAIVSDNDVIEWGRDAADAPGVRIENAVGSSVIGNRFTIGQFGTLAISVQPSSEAVTVFGNRILDPRGAAAAFEHLGAEANAGVVSIGAGATSVAVGASRVTSTSVIRLLMPWGQVADASAEPVEGGFTVRVSQPSAEGMVLWYEIQP